MCHMKRRDAVREGKKMKRGGQILGWMTLVRRQETFQKGPILASTMKIRITGAVCVVLTALGWGLNWPLTKVLIESFPPISARGMTGLVASAILFTATMARKDRLTIPRRD